MHILARRRFASAQTEISVTKSQMIWKLARGYHNRLIENLDSPDRCCLFPRVLGARVWADGKLAFQKRHLSLGRMATLCHRGSRRDLTVDLKASRTLRYVRRPGATVRSVTGAPFGPASLCPGVAFPTGGPVDTHTAATLPSNRVE